MVVSETFLFIAIISLMLGMSFGFYFLSPIIIIFSTLCSILSLAIGFKIQDQEIEKEFSEKFLWRIV